MKIAQSLIAMTSSRYFKTQHLKEEKLNFWIGNRSGERGQNLTAGDIVQISDEAVKAFAEQLPTPKAGKDGGLTFKLSAADKMKIKLVESILKAVTGKDFKIKVLDGIAVEENPGAEVASGSSTPAANNRVGWGMEYSYQESYQETEQLSYQARGVIMTADNREINFELNFDLQREFSYASSYSMRAGNARAVDPLVVNFAGGPASLTEAKYQFDLNNDNREEPVSLLQPGSGFLVLDKNGDQKINNGSELFGPSSGSGFSELAAYDSDNNNWIDESDPIFTQLQIWAKDEAGQDYLFSLAEKGIGAVFLGSATAQFNYKDQANQQLGEATQAGIFIREDGGAGTIQELNLVVGDSA